ncbi:alpha/beta hydrolase [Marasmitruncus massiliensis]|uniref:alpha/beta hydrolase n=1 Tax=Marasmitruncus massiliensis TaxID=1944642 RepID=UPI000C79EE67|nr:alpha/beta hydrolase [Marasmitruncus massiliensis]
MQKRKRKTTVIVLDLAILIVISVGLIFPPGRKSPKTYRDQTGEVLDGSISEKVFTEINGAQQGMYLKGKDLSNPVLLLLSGGPGIPDYFLTKEIDTGLEDTFTVCYWDYRGTGLSYTSKCKSEDCTTQQFVQDALVVTDYLRKRFGQEKIYLLGHSFGTYIGILTAQAAPEKYVAYIAMSQIADQPNSELMAYKTMKAEYATQGNQKMVRKLDAYQTDVPDTAWLRGWFVAPERDTAMHELGGGTMADMQSVITGIFFPTLRCTDYTQAERINIWRGKSFVQKTQVAYDRMKFVAEDSVPILKIPIYFLAGKQDLTCCYAMQKEYYDKIEAPLKGFYTFESSAHSPMFEQPGLAIRILRQDVMNGTDALADEK